MIHRWQADSESILHFYTGKNFYLSWGSGAVTLQHVRVGGGGGSSISSSSSGSSNSSNNSSFISS